MSGSGISSAICKSAPCSRQITTPAPHHSVFYRPDALPVAQPTASRAVFCNITKTTSQRQDGGNVSTRACTYAHMHRQPQNVMPPAPSTGQVEAGCITTTQLTVAGTLPTTAFTYAVAFRLWLLRYTFSTTPYFTQTHSICYHTQNFTC